MIITLLEIVAAPFKGRETKQAKSKYKADS